MSFSVANIENIFEYAKYLAYKFKISFAFPLALSLAHGDSPPPVRAESDLKERKKRGEKKKSPRTPLIKEKQPEKIEKEILSLDADAKEDFRKECLSFIGHYDEQQVTDFYHYWSEASKRGTMRFQRQKYWDTEKRLKRWCKNRYSSENTAAALRLERLKKKAPETEPERKRKQERLEQEIAERKRNAVSYEEYLRMKNGE